jgi:hypothetical protein
LYAIFCANIGVFIKNQFYDIFAKNSTNLSKKRQYFRHFFENILKILKSFLQSLVTTPALYKFTTQQIKIISRKNAQAYSNAGVVVGL